MVGDTTPRRYSSLLRRPDVTRRPKDVRAAATYLDLERKNARLQEAVAIVMLSDLAKWNLRLTETLTPNPTHLARRVKHEVRIPSASDLSHTVLSGRELPGPTEKRRILVPVAFRRRGKLLSGFTVSSSHEPVSVLNFGDGEEFTRKILARLIAVRTSTTPSTYLKDASWRLARILKDRYIQFVELDACLGDVVTIEYSVRFRHLEAAHDRLAAGRLALGWRQNRFRFVSELYENATSYHFHFDVPDGYVLKDMRLEGKDKSRTLSYRFNGAGTPDGHIYVSKNGNDEQRNPSATHIFIDCFEAPPGSQGYTAVLGCVTTIILFTLMAALSYGWFLDPQTQKMQATGAIALIAGGPAVVASILPLRNEPLSAIRSPLTARLALWASSVMSAFVALALATQGFGLDLAALKNAALFKCFIEGMVTTVAVIVALVACRKALNKRMFWAGVAPLICIAAIVYLILTQRGNVSAADIFFSAVVPLYILTWLRCVSGWMKSVYITSGISRKD